MPCTWDRGDRLWIGTLDGGACWYDGERFHPARECEGAITALAEDRQGRIWMGGIDALGYWDGSSYVDLVDAYGSDCGEKPDKGCWGIGQDEVGDVWIGGEILVRYDGDKFHRVEPEPGRSHEPGMAFAVGEDPAGGLWIARDWSVWRWRDGVFTALAAECPGGVRRVQADAGGRIWFSLHRGALCLTEGRKRLIGRRNGLVYDKITGVYEDREGLLWFATWGGGVCVWDPCIQHYQGEESGLPHHQIAALDRGGAKLWLGYSDLNPYGSVAQGVGYIEGDHYAGIGAQENRRIGPCLALCADGDDAVWIGSVNGLFYWDGRRLTPLGADGGLDGVAVTAILPDGAGGILLGHRHEHGNPARSRVGIMRFDGRSFETLYRADLDGSFAAIRALCRRSNGEIWFAVAGMAGQGEGLGIARLGTEIEYYGVESGLADARGEALLEDATGHLWIATCGGLNRFDGQGFAQFTVESGLPNDYVRCLHLDGDGCLWIGTDGGVVCSDGRVFQRIDTGSDAPIIEIREDGEGRICLATTGGLVRYTRSRHTPPSPTVQLVADRTYAADQEVEVAASIPQIAFEFGGASLRTPPQGMLYTCRLVGRETAWQTPTGQRRAVYQGLAAGDYTFEVKAIDRDLNYSPPARMALRVVPDSRDAHIDALEQQVRERTRELEEKNRALQEASRAKSEFLANMSHEIRTPMNAILGYAQLLRNNPALPAVQRPAIETIYQSGEHLLGLINEVLDISKIEAGRMELQVEVFSLAALLDGLVSSFEPLCRQRGLAWQLVQKGQRPPQVEADATKLRQVLTNLVGNAVKFTQVGEVVLEVAAMADGRYRFAVRDTGPGIAAGELVGLFEEFRQGAAGRAEGGTGLGLPLAQRYVELMGGALQVESQVGSGSVFWFELELPTAAGAQTAPVAQRCVVSGREVKALIADDVAENRDLLQQVLQQVGVAVVVAEDGLQALELLQREAVDIVFLDIRMPVLDGRQTLERIRAQARWQLLKVVAISASTLEHERQAVLDGGFDAFIGKPFRFEEVHEALAQMLGVEFEPVAEGGAASSGWSGLVLPDDLAARLREAAEFGQVTQLEGCFAEVEQLGPEGARLADHLRNLRRRHQLSAIEELSATLAG